MASADDLASVEEDDVVSVRSSVTTVSSVPCAEQLAKAETITKKPATGFLVPKVAMTMPKDALRFHTAFQAAFF